MVKCPACGATSRDGEFCDRCNHDLTPPPLLLPPAICPLNPEGPLYLSREQVATLSRPEAVVLIHTSQHVWRLHWIPHSVWPERRPDFEQRQRYPGAVLPPCRLVEDKEGVWVAAEATPLRVPPWVVSTHDTLEEVRRLAAFLDVLGEGLEQLHALGLVWLTFDPTQIELLAAPGANGDRLGGVRFTNLDLAVYPQGSCPPRLALRPKYAAPEVCRFEAASLGPRTDVFHLGIFAYYWLARMLPQGFYGNGLAAFDFAVPPLRTFAPHLPPGITAVLSRALAVEPGQRFAGPREFCAALRAALARAERRAASAQPVRWEIGVHARAGRAKAALQRPNQDHALARQFPSPSRALVAVADGITTCDVGSGELASRMVCTLLEEAFGPNSQAQHFRETITSACLRGANDLLSWALEQGFEQRLCEGVDLMGTTLTAGWLQGNQLTLANLGDSRAYLVEGAGAEQLTVDGDLGTGLLAAGVPPEDVREIGTMGRALRDCVGGCVRGPDGRLAIQERYCTPALSTWSLLPGDVIVLCTDGLVDEGVFLEPGELAELLRQNQHLSAQDLAVLLADTADARQRLPSDLEPEGFGDNVSCVVIKVTGS